MLPALACAVASIASVSLSHHLPQLHTAGAYIVDDRNRPVVLRGVNCASMEWSSDGDGHLMDTIRVAIKDWHSNIIRLPMSQDRWFGKATEQKGDAAPYRAIIKQAVDYCADNGCYILLDLHWNDVGEWGQNIGQHTMPDMYSVDFWKDCGREYRNNPAVLFDLYNEPHDTTWDIWLKGGMIHESRGPGARQGRFVPHDYQTPGMQALLDTVRSTGARNVVVCGGLDWAYDLSGFIKGYALNDPHGHGVIYACHNYPIKGDTINQWVAKLDTAYPHIPIIMSEFGSQNRRGPTYDQPNPWVQTVLQVADARKISWIAWDLHPSAGPTLVAGWNYDPTPSFGGLVKADLLASQ